MFLVWNLNLLWSLLMCKFLLLWWSFLLLFQIILLPLLLRFINENWTNLFTRAYFSFRLSKTIFPQSFFAISVVLSNCFKSPLKLTQWKKSLKRRRIINRRWKWRTFLWRPRLLTNRRSTQMQT
jgi:uncharacterized membrane protein